VLVRRGEAWCQLGIPSAFSMTPGGWRQMVEETRKLKAAIGRATSWEDRYRITREAVDDPDFIAFEYDGDDRTMAHDARLATSTRTPAAIPTAVRFVVRP
jgi:hypothetical protein